MRLYIVDAFTDSAFAGNPAATLATGHVLGGSQVFSTRSGELRTTAEDGWVRMDFPVDPPRAAADEVASALPSATIKEVLRGKTDILIRVDDAAEVRQLEPDLDAIAGWEARCVIVTAPADKPGIDFVSRVFGPAVGIPEDPVTGSAHCTLSPYWSAELGRDELVGEQASARGGVVRVALQGERVILAGQAVTTVHGELVV